MLVYIAGRYSRRDEFRGYRDRINATGNRVTSRWLDESVPLDGIYRGPDPDSFNAGVARIDLADIDDADTILFFAEDPLVGTPRGGRHVEFGYGLARDKWIMVIGPKENVFHYGSDQVQHFESFDEYMSKRLVTVTFD